jgi:hypothetical protein
MRGGDPTTSKKEMLYFARSIGMIAREGADNRATDLLKLNRSIVFMQKAVQRNLHEYLQDVYCIYKREVVSAAVSMGFLERISQLTTLKKLAREQISELSSFW